MEAVDDALLGRVTQSAPFAALLINIKTHRFPSKSYSQIEKKALYYFCFCMTKAGNKQSKVGYQCSTKHIY